MFGPYVESPHFHTVMLVVAMLIGLPVFIASFIKYKSKLILALGIIGLGLTTYGTIYGCDTDCSSCGTECSSCPAGEQQISEYAEVSESGCSDKDCLGCEVEKQFAPAGEDSTSEFEKADNTTKVDTKEVKSAGILGSIKMVPLGVTILILAHFLNFRKGRKSKDDDCCSSSTCQSNVSKS